MSVSDSEFPLKEFDASDHNLQKASLQKPELQETRPKKTKRKIDMSSKNPLVDGDSEELTDQHYEKLRLCAFNETWSKIEITIKDVLEKINISLFEDVMKWISESFKEIRSCRGEFVRELMLSYPIVTDMICKQIPTALILTKNMEFVDDLSTFQELSAHLKLNGCHVASLSSIDFTTKKGVGGCLRSLLRQLLVASSDAADIFVLASWYSEQHNCNKPIVIVIDDTEQCSGPILAEFIAMLSEWIIKIPILLVFGVATSLTSLRKLLPSDALQYLQSCQFTSESPQARMNSIIEAVLVKPSSEFIVSHKVAVFLRNYFLRHDGTITSFIQALKVACSKHFYTEPLSFLCCDLVDEDYEVLLAKKVESLPRKLLDYAFCLPSCEGKMNNGTFKDLVQGIFELKKTRRYWSMVLMCLLEVAKLNKLQLLDIFCEAANPTSFKLQSSSHLQAPTAISNTIHDMKIHGFGKNGFINRIINKTRDLQVVQLSRILKTWEGYTKEICEIQDKLKDLQTLLNATDNDTRLKQQLSNVHRSTSRFSSFSGKDMMGVNEKVALLMEGMVRDYMKPIECIPFHEIICFSLVDMLQEALIGDPRKTIQTDLLHSHTYIQCCCCKDKNTLLPSMHDTSIVFTLAQEHGDLVNLHDWYESYKSIILSSRTKARRKFNKSPASKKGKVSSALSDSSNLNEATIQARFCKAVTELQISGIIRMPSKRRPDYVQRITFGL
ncbi:Origin recognition complex subunit 3 [Zostera marina]|uniref:Origin recognition complex subunit 3 n=1 Tax=Zostera marina TaxID=29655 RepID=A0A0K9Q093_ZOSMR|nr:Origin recognition complex subunit 3 [Zostera marina]